MAGIAYGSCVLACVNGVVPALVAAIIVVCEIGERLSPHTAPEKIAPNTGYNNGSCSVAAGEAVPESATIIGIAIGIKSAIVAQEVPSKKLVIAVIMKNRHGNRLA